MRTKFEQEIIILTSNVGYRFLLNFRPFYGLLTFAINRARPDLGNHGF